MGSAETTRDLKDFLERLGRAVEVTKENRLVARARTALIEEEIEFNVLAAPKNKLLRKPINILPHGSRLPDNADEYDRVDYFSDFLDSTVHADRMARSVLTDDAIQVERENFIPQHISQDGSQLDPDATQFVRDWLQDDERKLLAVLAPAGYGKTSLTCEMTHQLATDYLDRKPDGPEPFPFRVPFGEFRRLASFEGMILSALERAQITDYTSSAFAYLVAQRRAVLILDGFDELLEERPEEARQNLRELIETLGGMGKVVITARSTFFRTSDQVSEFLEYELVRDQVDVIELLPFDKSQRMQLVAKKSSTQADIRRISQFIGADGLDQPMGSPLLLNETIEALQQPDTASRLDREAGRKNLFRALEASVYERERIRQSHDFTDDDQREFLDRLAGELLRGNERGYDYQSVHVVALEAVGRDLTEGELEHLADHHFLHVPHSDLPPDERPVHFNHQVFREYFQARSLLDACENSNLGWVYAMLVHRPIPEEVTRWCAELDSDRKLPENLLDELNRASTPSAGLVQNIAAICAAYGNPALVMRVLTAAPTDLPLALRLEHLDLSRSNFSGRYFQELVFDECKLDQSDFSDSLIAELSLDKCSVSGALFEGATIESIALDYGERVFGPPEALRLLDERGARAGLEHKQAIAKARSNRSEKVIETVKRRLGRFYVPGATGSHEGSKWKGEIVERNLYGGLDPADRKWVKSKVIPSMVSTDVLVRRRNHGMTLYRLTENAEDDARALIEKGQLTGRIKNLVARLS
jgi:hypothetical protein